MARKETRKKTQNRPGKTTRSSSRRSKLTNDNPGATTRTRTHAGRRLPAAIADHRAGRLDKSEPVYAELLRLEPRNAELQFLYGTLLHQRGRQADARRHLERAIALDGRRAAYHSNLGLVLLAQNAAGEAISALRRATRLSPGYAEAHNNLGLALQICGHDEAATAAYARAVELRPEYGDALNNLGVMLLREGRARAAADILQRAVRVADDHADAWTNLGAAYMALDQPDEGASALARARDARPSARAEGNLGHALSVIGRRDEAADALARAIALEPDEATHYVRAGINEAARGRQQAAIAAFETALRAQPGRADAIYQLAGLGHWPNPPGVAAALADPSTSDSDRILLHFSEAARLDSIGAWEAAFEHLCAGNALRRAADTAMGLVYDPIARGTDADRVIAAFGPERFAEVVDATDDETPIFIVGAAGSGLEVVEDVLSSHPRVAAGGEQFALQRTVQAFIESARSSTPYPESIAELDGAAARSLARTYLAATQPRLEHRPGARRVTDRMPGNALHLGLIGLILPHARIIDVRRDPRDSGFACFARNPDRPYPFATDLVDIAHQQWLHARFMDHWRAVLPNPFIEIEFESLVIEPERVVPELQAFCGLDSGYACAHPAPAYAANIGRWRAYGSWLDPILEAIGTQDTPALTMPAA